MHGLVEIKSIRESSISITSLANTHVLKSLSPTRIPAKASWAHVGGIKVQPGFSYDSMLQETVRGKLVGSIANIRSEEVV